MPDNAAVFKLARRAGRGRLIVMPDTRPAVGAWFEPVRRQIQWFWFFCTSCGLFVHQAAELPDQGAVTGGDLDSFI